MNAYARAAALFLPMTLALIAATPPATAAEVSLLKDLTAVITLLGMPCGEVVSASTQAANDQIATCRDGNRYRVYVNAAGRVVAQKQ